MPVLLLLFLTLALLPERWPEPAEWLARLPLSVGLTWLVILLEVLFAAVISRRTCRALRDESRDREDILRSYLRGRRFHTLGLFLSYGLALYLFGYGWAVHTLWSGPEGVLPGAEVLLLAPFFVGLLLSWACFHDAERAFWYDPIGPEPASPFFSRRAFVWFHLRQNLALVFLPIVLLMGEKEARRLFPDLDQAWQVQ